MYTLIKYIKINTPINLLQWNAHVKYFSKAFSCVIKNVRKNKICKLIYKNEKKRKL